MLERIFRLSEHGTTVRVELLAGLTTFLTMAYIIFLQPAILSGNLSGEPTGMDFGAVVLATCVSAALTTIFMGLYARYPIALAPGMGENFVFVTLIAALAGAGVPDAWKAALTVVLISGILFLLATVLRIREAILEAVSPSQRNAIAVGIGIFIAFIGLENARVIVGTPGTPVALNTTHSPAHIAVFFFGLFVMAMLQARHVRGAVLWGILAGTGLALIVARNQMALPGPAWKLWGFPTIAQHTAFRFDFATIARQATICVPYIVIFLFMDIFDTLGTLIGVAEQAGFVKENRLPRASRVLLVDSVGTVVGASMGTSTVTSYIESATGVAYGGRTGLTAVAAGALFLAALVFGPLIHMIASFEPITAPALVVVGMLMMRNVQKVQWEDFSESIPAFLTILGIPLCYSIADGLALGFISYPIVKFLAGRGREVRWLSYVLALVLLAYLLLVRANLIAALSGGRH